MLKKHRGEKLYGNINPATLTDRQRSDYLVLQGAILREEAYVTWLRESITLLGS